jgi:signal transduction histidine kinase
MCPSARKVGKTADATAMASVNLITLARPTPDEAPLQAQLNEALVRELVLTAKGGAAGLLGATVLYAILVGPWDSPLLIGLFALLFGVTLFRLGFVLWLMRGAMQRMSSMRVFAWLAVIYGASGVALSAILIASAPHVGVVKVLMLLVVMIGINSTAMVTLAGSPLLYMLYLSTPLVAWNIIAYTDPLPGLNHALQAALPVYAIAQLVTMRSVHRSLRNNVVLRLRLAASLGELRDAQSQLVEASRQAGRSDVATAVLHNVGNVLNSVNVSATLASDIITQLQTGGLAKAAALITDHGDDLERFLRDDPRGRKLPEYLSQLHRVLERDQIAASSELRTLMRNIDHIKVIVASQQSHVKPGGLVETFAISELLDDAVAFSAASDDDDAIEIVRDDASLPAVTLDRHKALQILMNLLTNARDAVRDMPPGQRRITVRSRRGGPGNFEIAIEDSGCGIAAQNLERIFQLGFTTKPSGNGLGLHYSACAALELQGRLTARSDGPARGAAFLLVLPIDAQAQRSDRLSA